MSDEATPRVSLILPTWNGEHELPALLDRIESQDAVGGVELLAVDSSSTDGTVPLLESRGVRVTVIPKEEFSHGGTRALCAERARGEFLVFLSQDSVPRDEGFLRALLEPFEDPDTAATYARVLPAPGDDPLTARTVLDLPEAAPEPHLHQLGPEEDLWTLEPIERVERIRFNNVASAIRRSAFERLPFPAIEFGEDFAWAALALTAGWRVAYAPEAVVQHAHRYGPRGAFSRYRTDALFHRLAHGWRMRPTIGATLRGLLFEVVADARFVLGSPGRAWPVGVRIQALLRSPSLRAGQILGQYAGSRALGVSRTRSLIPAPSPGADLGSLFARRG